jgi:hypothetical protein
VIAPDGSRGNQQQAVARLLEIARRKLPHLPAAGSGIFLQNGSRLYIDSGNHPELSTSEVVDPWEACRYVLAGHRILTDLAAQVSVEAPALGQIFITCCNIGYGHERTTWGAHESYAHQAKPVELCKHLVPHLVSRVIYCGAGGFDSRVPGIEFLVSPRVAHLECVTSGSSTGNRGIYHQKNETLSNGQYSRLHILCGESLCSQTALWLKTAITALVVALVEAGFKPCRRVYLRDPLAAMRLFAADPACTARAECADGKQRTALDIQRHIFRQIESHLDHRVMPDWAPEACRRLHAILDRLEDAPVRVARTLDWAIKLSLYQEVARRHGIPWESLPDWNRRLCQWMAEHETSANAGPPARETSEHLVAVSHEGSPRRLLIERLVGRRTSSGQAEQVSDAGAANRPNLVGRAHHASSAGRTPEPPRDLGRFLQLRNVLMELDTRFAQLGDQGLFQILDRSGTLEHALAGVVNIEGAKSEPPSVGRARLRGASVRQMHGERRSGVCDWTGVWDQAQRRYLDLFDPFVSDAVWKDLPDGETPFQNQPCSLCHQVNALCDAGRFDEAQTILEQNPTPGLTGLTDVCASRFRAFRSRIAQGRRAASTRRQDTH